jgi:hypothetical protein
LQVREPTNQSGGSIGGTADERSYTVWKMLAADCETAHMSRFLSHGFNKNAKFPPEIFWQRHHPNKINYLAASLAGVEGVP